MGFNYAKELIKWEKWKSKEEELLRSLNVDEKTIQQLHEYDWEMFKSDRRIRRRQYATLDSFFSQIPYYDKKELKTIEDLLDEIENELLFNFLSKTDKTTLTIILLKILGYSTNEISKILGLSCSSIYKKIQRLKRNFKKL